MSAKGMFDNSDVNHCPIISVELVDISGNALSTEVSSIIKVDNHNGSFEKFIMINQDNFLTGTPKFSVKIKVHTAFAEPVFKEI